MMIILIIMRSIRNKDDAGGPISAGALSADRLVARLTPFELLRISESTRQSDSDVH